MRPFNRLSAPVALLVLACLAGPLVLGRVHALRHGSEASHSDGCEVCRLVGSAPLPPSAPTVACKPALHGNLPIDRSRAGAAWLELAPPSSRGPPTRVG